jgi:hypothetical protein
MTNIVSIRTATIASLLTALVVASAEAPLRAAATEWGGDASRSTGGAAGARVPVASGSPVGQAPGDLRELPTVAGYRIDVGAPAVAGPSSTQLRISASNYKPATLPRSALAAFAGGGAGNPSLPGVPLLFVTIDSSRDVNAVSSPSFAFVLPASARASDNQYAIAEYDGRTRVLELGKLTPTSVAGSTLYFKGYASTVHLAPGVPAVWVLYAQRQPSPPAHIPTADFFGGPYGTHSFSATAVAPYLDWAEVLPVDEAAVHSAGIKTLLYTNPNEQNSSGPMYTSNERTFSHDCAGDRITDTQYQTPTYYMAKNEVMRWVWRDYVDSVVAANPFDAIYEDTAGSLKYNYSALPCHYRVATWLLDEARNESGLGQPVINNSLGVLRGGGPSHLENDWTPSLGLTALTPTSRGASFEGCFVQNGRVPEQSNGTVWTATEETMILMQQRYNKPMICLSPFAVNSLDAAASTALRLYTYASYAMVYSPSGSAPTYLWDMYQTPSNVHVLPESLLVLINPLARTPVRIKDLEERGGTYARRYRSCYLAGVFEGACAVVVNPDSYHTSPNPLAARYTQTLALQGYDVLDGGTASVSPIPPPATLAPMTAAVMFTASAN